MTSENPLARVAGLLYLVLAVCRNGLVGLLADGLDGLGHPGLVVGRVVGVDDALGRGLVVGPVGVAKRGLGGLAVAAGDGLAELAAGRLQRRLDGLVAEPALLVLPVALDL